MNAIVERFARLAREDPDRPLLHLAFSQHTLRASTLWQAHRAHRARLVSLGIAAGDVVLIASGNRASSITLMLAAWAHGAAVMPVDAGTPRPEIDALAARFHAAVIAVPADAVAAHYPEAQALDDQLALVRREDSPPPSARIPDAAVFKVTSGSTALPKAVCVTAGQVIADTDHIVEAMGIRPDDIQVAVIPLSHAYGFGNLIIPMLLNGTAMVLRESFVPQHLPGDARRFGARVFHGVPFMYQYFVTNPPADGWPACLQLLISAGAPLESETVAGFDQAFGVKIHSFYGTSESGGISFDRSHDVDRQPTVGWPLPGVAVTLVTGEGIPGGCGRIHVRSAAVARGYVGDTGSSDAFADDGFLTGDYGSFLPDGRLALSGRISAFINVAGRKVHPGDVERVLQSIDGITDARVMVAADARRGEQIAAVLAGGQGLSPADVRRYCASRLAPHKIPRIVVFVDAMPLNARGKTDHRALEALVAAHEPVDRGGVL
ncbi:MAG: class I adenylate-forming enzyme family protein [Acidobacteriota bacterium]